MDNLVALLKKITRGIKAKWSTVKVDRTKRAKN